MDPAQIDILKQEILRVEQRINSMSAAIGHSIASTGFWLIVMTVVVLAHSTGRSAFIGRYLLDSLLGPIIFVLLALVIRWLRGRTEVHLRHLKEAEHTEPPKGVWPPAPLEPR